MEPPLFLFAHLGSHTRPGSFPVMVDGNAFGRTRSFFFTFVFSAGVVGLARTQNRREANAESFLVDTGIGQTSI
jgi:hypothetical protein